MESLGTTIKNVLGANNSQGDTTDTKYSPPGSYPKDSETGTGATNAPSAPTHNKLHKPGDPRGNTETSRGHGHGHTDSGVGLTSTHDSTPSQQLGSTGGNTAGTAFGNTGRDHVGSSTGGNTAGNTIGNTGRDHIGSNTGNTAENTIGNTGRDHIGSNTGSTAENTIGNTGRDHLGSNTGNTAGDTAGATAGTIGSTGLASHQGDTTGHHAAGQQNLGRDAATSGEHPYWGDLPQNTGNTGSGGVYNTVVGHGSPEDEAKRHQEIHQGHSSTDAPHTGSDRTGRGPTTGSTQRTLPLDTDKSYAEGSRPIGDESHSRSKGTAAAAAAGIGGAGAYKLGQDHKASHGDHKDNLTTENPTRDTKHTKHHTEHAAKPEHSHVKQSHHPEDVKGSHSPQEKKDHKLFGLFHRSSGDKTKDVAHDKHHGEQGTTSHHQGREDEKHLGTERGIDNKNKESGGHSAATALAAGGAAAAWAGSRNSGRDNEGKLTDRSVAGQQQPHSTTQGHHGGQSTTLGSENPYNTQTGNTQTGNTRSHDRSVPAAAAAGLGAGALASHGTSHGTDQSRDAPTARDPSQGSHGEQYNVLGSGRPSGIRVGDDSSSPRDTTGHSGVGQTHAPAHGSGTYAGVDRGVVAPDSSRSGYPTTGFQGESTTRHPGEQHGISSTQRSGTEGYAPETSRDNHHGLATATALGVGAGAGAGALASRDKKDQHGTSSGGPPVETARWKDQNTSTDQTHRAAAGVVPNTTPSHPSDQTRQQHTGLGSSATPRSNAPTTQTGSSDASHHGMYNVLASGTPSGIRVDDVDHNNRPIPAHETQSQSQSQTQSHTQTPQDNKHSGAKAAAAGLGAAGVGAAAYGSQRPHEDKLDRNDRPLGQERGDQTTADRRDQAVPPQSDRSLPGAGTAAYGSQRPQDDKLDRVERPLGQEREGQTGLTGQTGQSTTVPPQGDRSLPGVGGLGRKTHKCTNCGVENDISKYFKGLS